MIHPTAIIHPDAQIDPTADVGPCAVIDGEVQLGAHCVVGPQVHLTGRTVIGQRNRFFAGCVIGGEPQDLRYAGEPTVVRIGDGNVFREHVTVHRSNKVGEETVIGSNCYLMANAHIGHNAVVGNHVIIANGALLGGHAQVHDRAFISGNCMIHQFTRVGTLAMMQGGSGISKDLPPFSMARGVNTQCGLNSVGLRRAGFTSAQRLELRRLYHALFRSGGLFRDALAAAAREFSSPATLTVLEFVGESKRGVCADIGQGHGGDEDSSEE